MEQVRRQYPLGFCPLLGVSASGFHASRSRGPSLRAQRGVRQKTEIRAAHWRTRQTYGPERLQPELGANGVCIGVHRIKRLRRKLWLRCKQWCKFKVPPDSRQSLPVAESLLDRRFQAKDCKVLFLNAIGDSPSRSRRHRLLSWRTSFSLHLTWVEQRR